MADYSTPEISILKDTLCAQQHLLQKLYSELDAEREASATAASEALSVILCLQGEKAAVKMEAEQFKRLSEEKMCHAEESFAIIDDIIYQKEMEVAALDYQVQAYRYRLLSMGCADPGGGEIKFPEKLLQRSDSLTGNSILRRRNSMPVLLKYNKKGVVDRESSLSPKPDSVSKNAEDPTVQEINDAGSGSERKPDGSTHGGGCIMSYGEEIRKLEVRVKEITGANYYSSRNEMRSPISSRLSVGNLSHLSNSGNPYDPKVASEPCVLDVFEVPRVDHLEAARYDEPGWLRKLFPSTRVCKPGHIDGVDRAVVQCTTIAGESRPGLNLSNEISGIREIERIGESSSREEELKLLRDIKEKLDLLRDDIKSQKVTKPTAREKPTLCPLPEAMLHFWL